MKGQAQKIFLLLSMFICSYFPLHALLDLDTMVQDYVLEMKQIKVPGYPETLNPSVIRWKEQILLCFRIRDPLTSVANGVGLVWLDENFKPYGTPQILHLPQYSPDPRPQDPKLVIVKDKLYIVYSDILNQHTTQEFRRMCVSELVYKNNQFTCLDNRIMLKFPGEHSNRREKNWVPFDYMGNMLLAYSINPHLVFHLFSKGHEADFFAYSKGAIDWKWGELRGGTPALLVDGQYLAFFHSSKAMKTVQSKKQMMSHYFMGAYTFLAHPPFSITGISPEPIIGDKFYNGPEYPMWKPLRVVFPGGYLFDKNHIWVVYGREDHEMWVVKLNKKMLMESLIPIATFE